MAEEKKIDGADDPISLLLEQALTRQRDEMMENFSHILQRLSIASGASSSSDHFGGTSLFKVQVNFDIPVFEGQIDADALDKWLNLLEGYFSVHNLLGAEFHRGFWNIWGRAHLGFFCGCGKSTVLPCWQL